MTKRSAHSRRRRRNRHRQPFDPKEYTVKTLFTIATLLTVALAMFWLLIEAPTVIAAIVVTAFVGWLALAWAK